MEWKNSIKWIWFCFIYLGIMVSCEKKDPEIVIKPKPYTLNIPPYFPTKLNIPADNPLTVEGIALGKKLFFDGRLSGRTEHDSLMSCSTCHRKENSYECGVTAFNQGHPYGLTGISTTHTMLPLINLVFNHSGYGWNGFISNKNLQLGNITLGVPEQQPYHYQNLESFVWMMIVAPDEAHGSIEKSIRLIASLPEYPPLFKAAFGTPEVNMDRIAKAIAQYIRTLISADSKFDHYLQGKASLTDDEMAGYVLFTTEEGADCFHCHGGEGNMLFTTNEYVNNGLDINPNDLYDRYAITNHPEDKGAYKVPTLRNIAYTAPYMHDGRFKTLDEVLDFYSEGVQLAPNISPMMHHALQGGVQLTRKEKEQLKAFLKTLSDSAFVSQP